MCVQVECGGDVDLKERYVAPTLISGVKPDSKIMKEEIFGTSDKGLVDLSHCPSKRHVQGGYGSEQ